MIFQASHHLETINVNWSFNACHFSLGHATKNKNKQQVQPVRDVSHDSRPEDDDVLEARAPVVVSSWRQWRSKDVIALAISPVVFQAPVKLNIGKKTNNNNDLM